MLDVSGASNKSVIMDAHGADATLIGDEVFNLQGKQGAYVIQDFISATDSDLAGWTTYYWPDPSTENNDIKAKHSYVVRIGDVIIGAGTYEHSILTDVEQETLKSFVNSAVTYYETEGLDKATDAFSAPSTEFVDGELYIFMIDISEADKEKAIMIAHGGLESLIGDDTMFTFKGQREEFVTQDMIYAL